MSDKPVMIGVVGGSGMDNPELLKDYQVKTVKTPYGDTSAPLITGTINGRPVVFLSRHNKDHSIMPTRVPYRANIWALREVGCTHILATTACGSLREEIRPGDLVFPDQFIDHTRHRALTFHEDQVIHTPMADPFCSDLRAVLAQVATELGLTYHDHGVVITIEGPRFSSRAESKMFRLWGADVINMSTVPEVTLAREAGLCYQSIAMSTDYDCWKQDEAPVTWEMIVERMHQNADHVTKLLLATIPRIEAKKSCC